MRWARTATLVAIFSFDALATPPRSPTLIPEAGSSVPCTLTEQERLDAARRIVSCEATRDQLKQELKATPDPRVMIALGFLGGFVVGGAVAYVVTR